MPRKIVIATRESALALWQANFIRHWLMELYPQTEISILGMTTRGDQILDTSLSKIGGKGLFIKELEQALEDGRADIAVHSMKDLPMNMPAGYALAAITEREDPRDAFVSNQYISLDTPPPGASLAHPVFDAKVNYTHISHIYKYCPCVAMYKLVYVN